MAAYLTVGRRSRFSPGPRRTGGFPGGALPGRPDGMPAPASMKGALADFAFVDFLMRRSTEQYIETNDDVPDVRLSQNEDSRHMPNVYFTHRRRTLRYTRSRNAFVSVGDRLCRTFQPTCRRRLPGSRRCRQTRARKELRAEYQSFSGDLHRCFMV